MIRWLMARLGYVPQTSPAPPAIADDETSVDKELRALRRDVRRLREDVDYQEKAIARLRGRVTGGLRRDDDEDDDEDLGDMLPSRRYRTPAADPQRELLDDDEEEED